MNNTQVIGPECYNPLCVHQSCGEIIRGQAQATPVLMNPTQARIYFEARGAYAKRVSRLSRATLATDYRAELADRGMSLLYGGPATKDELLTAIINLRYPVAKINEATHVLYHSSDFPNEVCAYCNPDPCPACGALEACEWDPEHGPVINGRHVR